MEAATPPITETLDHPRRRGWPRRAAVRAAWIALDLVAIGGFAAFAIRALT
jgi:hypothetical protein